MKTESPTSTIEATSNNISNMAFDMYPSISGKQDPVREVVMKYIDYFLPDASGTSAVAIDNKIEQAMDLVKSHLMIAVREEVEVLKEKISELLDKINQLEVENTMLKANIPSETLQQLQITGSAPSNMIAAAPANQSTVATPTGIAATAVSGGTGGNTTPAVSMASPTAAATPTSSAATDVSVGSETSSNEVVSTISELPGVSSNGPMS